MIDRRKEFSGAGAVRPGYEIDTAALHDYMTAHVEGFSGTLTISQFKGGQSNPTYKLSAGGKNYVLRRKPSGDLLKSAHAVDREYRVITALGQTDVPVPRTYALCTDDNVIGSWFYIMDFVEGRIFWDPALPELERGQRAAIYDAMNQTIARLHSVDITAVGLEDYGRPGNYIARQVARWSKQYRASRAAEAASFEHLIEWLPAHIPDEDATALSHGDFRLDNMIFHPREPRVLAVLDWELSTLGNPLSDFNYNCMAYRMPPGLFSGLAGLDLAALGIPPEEDYVAAYCRRTGREQIEHWDYYFAFNMFRLAAIAAGIMGRVRDGTAASPQARAMGEKAVPLADLAWRIACGKL